jgi:hypothetical protein
MGFQWRGYTGDIAGQVPGRKPYVALIEPTVWDGDHWIGPGVMDNVVIDGQTVYPGIWVDILTPDALMPVVTRVDFSGAALQLTVAPLVLDETGEDWAPGVHLLSFSVGHGGQQTETLATIIVPKGKFKRAPKLSAAGFRELVRARRPGMKG